jgi:hypothetical protein
MNGFVSVALITVLLTGVAAPSDQAVTESVRADQDVALTLDPQAAFWRDARPVFFETNKFGKPVSHFRVEVRTRWTAKNIYVLFISPFEELHLKPNPDTKKETNELWNWDVAEVFIGSDFKNIRHYKEFEVSPQGEWVDLDIDLGKPHHEDGWTWNSGIEVMARADSVNHIWRAAMRIPFSSIDTRPPQPGNTLRINFFLSEGPPSNHRELAWQAPMSDTFHVPEKFGLLRLVDK